MNAIQTFEDLAAHFRDYQHELLGVYSPDMDVAFSGLTLEHLCEAVFALRFARQFACRCRQCTCGDLKEF